MLILYLSKYNILLTKVLVKKYSMIVIGAALYTSVLKMMLNERANEQQQTTNFFLNSLTKLSILIVKVNLINEYRNVTCELWTTTQYQNFSQIPFNKR